MKYFQLLKNITVKYPSINSEIHSVADLIPRPTPFFVLFLSHLSPQYMFAIKGGTEWNKG